MVVDSIDWRSHKGKDWLGPVVDQVNCNAGWAISSVETLQAALAIKKGKGSISRISPRHLIDCDTKENSKCQSGDPAKAWKFLNKGTYFPPSRY